MAIIIGASFAPGFSGLCCFGTIIREPGVPFEGDIGTEKKGCCNATADFDELFFISTGPALHLCMGLMKENRPALLATALPACVKCN